MDTLQTLSLHTYCLPSSCLSWSLDNRLAVATDKAVLVYNLSANPRFTSSSLNLKESFLLSSTESNPYLLSTGLDYDKIMQKLPVEEQHRLHVATVIHPKTDSNKDEEIFIRANTVAWSPIGALVKGKFTDNLLIHNIFH